MAGRIGWFRIGLTLTALAALVGGWIAQSVILERATRTGRSVDGQFIRGSGGTLLIAGGGQLPDTVVRRFVELVGGPNGRLVVIPAGPADDNLVAYYEDYWGQYKIASVRVLAASSRQAADDPEFSLPLTTATGVWLGGGQQSWLAAHYGETLVEQRLRELLDRNGVIGGTSAGAAIMSSVMIEGGRGEPEVSRGFGLIPGAVIDQHFVKRNRFRRLQSVLGDNPDLIGFGIDEGTAMLFAVQTGRLKVIGSSCVVACVPPNGTDDRSDFTIEFLNAGDEFDMDRLRQGVPLPPTTMDWAQFQMGD